MDQPLAAPYPDIEYQDSISLKEKILNHPSVATSEEGPVHIIMPSVDFFEWHHPVACSLQIYYRYY